jgi:mRNA interferase RelE/StbE
LAETETFSKKIYSKKYNHLYNIIYNDVYPILKVNPYFGSNIKKLKGVYKELYRFRIGDYRIFYKIDEQESIIFILNKESNV